MAGREWTRFELILAMNLYCQLPFGKLHKGTPEIIALANAIERTPSSVGMKLCNFASLDPAHQERGVKGLSGASVADRNTWEEFHANWDALVVESESIRRDLNLSNIKPFGTKETETQSSQDVFVGESETERTIKVRLAQRFFRSAVLASYETRCCISGIQQPDLLIASHIVPWSILKEHRTNPRNGLCLSRIHDGAFDTGLITISSEWRLVVSRELKENLANDVLHSAFGVYEGRVISMPSRFRPDARFLATHRETIFRGV